MRSFDELLTWRESSTTADAIGAAATAAGGAPSGLLDLLADAERIVVTGAGSSYYLAQSTAAGARQLLHKPVQAAPLSELIFRPGGVLVGGPLAGGDGRSSGLSGSAASTGANDREPVVVISRSGSTTEAVSVVERMREAGHPTIAVTCRQESPLATLATWTLVSPAGDEAAIVMTRSFASMLALVLGVVARAAGDRAVVDDLARAGGHWAEAAAAAAVGRRLGATSWSRVVVLGGGPASGIAAEWGLKLTETSQIPTNTYEPLEFRHGPISVCEPGTLVVGLVGGAGSAEEVAVLGEAVDVGATTWLIARDEDEARGAPGEVSLVGRGLHPIARLPLLLHPGHALALSIALARGRDPDAPRHLGQVVILRSE